MMNQNYVDLWDEYNCADSCDAVMRLCGLVDKLVEDVQYLEEQCVGLRYELCKYLEADHGEALKSDILSALARRYDGDPAYDFYKNLVYNGGDPMQFKSWTDRIRKASKGGGDICM